MNTVVYAARVEGDVAGYRATFPDFTELSATADSLTNLLPEARASLLRALKMIESAGGVWPTPTSMEALRAQAGDPAMTLLLIDLQVDDTPIRVNISIGERLLKRLDEAAGAQDMSRSGFIAAAVRQRLGENPGAERSTADPASQRLFEEVAAVGRRMNEAIGPESRFGRAVAELDHRALEGLRALTGMIAPKTREEARPTKADPEHDG